ncbi:MAG: hypothetical protein KIT33_02265 [Candidatus Kapabacteria bacterium]|nr:hypothetical protein [Ignavibacteriota bacterium]MCW5883774.1 hypothetical protein [Candidatus Kapabacteria bacterium]
MKKLFFVIILSGFCLFSCDEIDNIINPKSEYLINKTLSHTTDEQIITHGNDLKIIIPGSCLQGELTIKVKNEENPPGFNIQNITLGNNLFNVNFSGNINILKPIQFTINYDESRIKSGANADDVVKGLIFSGGFWKIASYSIDRINKKIVFEISNLSQPSVNKDIPVLLENDGVVFGDGYSTTDTGNDDNLLKILPNCLVTMYSARYPNGYPIFVNNKLSGNYESSLNPFTFSGDNFSIDYNSRPDIDPSTINPSITFWFQYLKYKASGQVKNNSHSVLTQFNVQDYRSYHASQIDWNDLNLNFTLSDVKLSYQSKENDTLIYYLDKNEVNRCLKSFYFNYNHLWESKVYTQTKSDINVLIIRFTLK